MAADYSKVLHLHGNCSASVHALHTLHVQYQLGQGLFIFLLQEILDIIVITSHFIAHYELNKCRKLQQQRNTGYVTYFVKVTYLGSKQIMAFITKWAKIFLRKKLLFPRSTFFFTKVNIVVLRFKKKKIESVRNILGFHFRFCADHNIMIFFFF